MTTPRDQWHILTEKDYEKRTAVCAVCGPGASFVLRGMQQKARCRAVYHRHKRKRGSHGLTIEEAREYRSGKVCEVCGSDVNLAVDHDHATGTIRGVLCYGCNVALGLLKDDPQRLRDLATYLENHTPHLAPPA